LKFAPIRPYSPLIRNELNNLPSTHHRNDRDISYIATIATIKSLTIGIINAYRSERREQQHSDVRGEATLSLQQCHHPI
jgi:hypothetical protein